MAAAETASRLGCLFVFSVVAGAIVGGTAASAMLPIDGPFFGGIFGGVIGAFLSPVIMATLARKQLLVATLLVFVPSMVVAFIAGKTLHPGVTLLSVIVFCSMAAVAFLILPNVYPPRHAGQCPDCGYDVRELSQCPECGCDPRTAAPDVSRSPRIAAGAILVVGLLLPLLAAIYAARDRHRPRTTAEWVQRLAHHDMQIQWEARQALIERGALPLIEALSHPSPRVRENAAMALQQLRDPAARDALTAALQDPDPRVRSRAAAALKALGDP